MFLTLFILNQLWLPGTPPAATLHSYPVQGISLHQEPQHTAATLKVTYQTTGIVLHQTEVQGIVLHPTQITPVATFTVDNY